MIRPTFRRSWLLLPIDLLFIFFATYISFQLRFNFSIPSQYNHSIMTYLVVSPIVYITSFVLFRMYTRIWRHAGTRDLEAIIFANGCAAIILKVIDMLSPGVNFPLSVWMSALLLTMSLTGGGRLGYGIYAQRFMLRKPAELVAKEKNILIYGAGAAGAIVSREIIRDKVANQKVIGFIDDDVKRAGMQLNGCRVFGDRTVISSVVNTHNVHQILVAIPSLSRAKLADLVQELEQYKVPIYIIPPFTRWMVNNLWGQAKQVDVEDLLGRDPLPVDVEKVGTYLAEAVVLVTGAGGSIGSEICRQVAQLHPRLLVLLGRGENSIFEIVGELKSAYPGLRIDFAIGDVRDEKKMESVISAIRPNVIFHAAAHKHVPLMEEHPDEAFLNNVVATWQLAQLAKRYRVGRFIAISSDKAVRPTNVMGSSKRIAEMAVQDIAETSMFTKFVAVRFGNVLGSRGSVVKVFRQQIATGGPLTVTDERMMRYFMTIPEAVRLVIEAGAMGENGHVYLLDMGEPVRIADLAERMIRLSGYEPGVDIKIEYMGIRPGEKLFEELSRESDSVSIDTHDRIWAVKCPVMPHETFMDAIDMLYQLYDDGDKGGLAAALKELAWWEPDGVAEQNRVALAGVAAAFLEGAAAVERIVD